MADSKKLKTANSQFFFAKISEIGPWVIIDAKGIDVA